MSGWAPANALPEIAGPEYVPLGVAGDVVDVVDEPPQPTTAAATIEIRQTADAELRREGLIVSLKEYSIQP